MPVPRHQVHGGIHPWEQEGPADKGRVDLNIKIDAGARPTGVSGASWVREPGSGRLARNCGLPG